MWSNGFNQALPLCNVSVGYAIVFALIGLCDKLNVRLWIQIFILACVI